MFRPTANRLLVTARREALVTFLVWCAACVYSVGYCTTYGYGRSMDDLTFVLGFPDWVFWGVIVPWGVCYVISAVMAFVVMQDAPLEDDSPEEQLSGTRGDAR